MVSTVERFNFIEMVGFELRMYLSSYRVTRSTLRCCGMAKAGPVMDGDIVYSGYLLYKVKGKLSCVSCTMALRVSVGQLCSL